MTADTMSEAALLTRGRHVRLYTREQLREAHMAHCHRFLIGALVFGPVLTSCGQVTSPGIEGRWAATSSRFSPTLRNSGSFAWCLPN